ncbi:MAG: hypothetical protein LLF94_11405 [Chlamydiales bacterium]|nr:hypothetical protein [Chlamydiales bacterium]
MSSVVESNSENHALLSVVCDQEEPSLDLFVEPPVNKRVEACKEALYSTFLGSAWGLVTGLPIALLAYANGSVPECLAVAAVADTVGGAVGALFGTIVENSVGTNKKSRVISALIAGYGAAAAGLSIYNATMCGVAKTPPVWSQVVVGLPLVCTGAFASGCMSPRLGRHLSGFLASAGTGCMTGVSVAKVLSIVLPQVGPKASPMLGLLGVQGMLGYTIASDKYKKGKN